MDATTILANMLREGRATVNEVRAINEAYRDGVLTERKRCAAVARAEPEFEGEPNEATLDAMNAVGPVENARCAARVVKRKIAAAIESGQ